MPKNFLKRLIIVPLAYLIGVTSSLSGAQDDKEFLHGFMDFEAVNLGAVIENLEHKDCKTISAEKEMARCKLMKKYGAATENYYNQIDPKNKRKTLTDFRKKNKFDPEDCTSDCNFVRAAFANSNDLGFGRDMYCKTDPPDKQEDVGVACYVTNYGLLDGNNDDDQKDANDAAEQKPREYYLPLATVAMEYSAIEGATSSKRVVKFYVFVGDDRVNFADLDSNKTKNRPVPQLCMACHGGVLQNTAKLGKDIPPFFNSPKDVDLGAEFLPFDVVQFTFPKVSNFAKDEQQEEIWQLNQIVKMTNPNPAIVEVIDAMYDNANGKTQKEEFVVAGWQDHSEFYKKFVGPMCRECHIANSHTEYRLNSSEHFIRLLGNIENRVCTQGLMPYANVTYNNHKANMVSLLQTFGKRVSIGKNGWTNTKCKEQEQDMSDYEKLIQRNIFDGFTVNQRKPCSSCHYGSSPAGGLRLDKGHSYDALVILNSINVLEGQNSKRPGLEKVKLIVPGNPADSFLIKKMMDSHDDRGLMAGDCMPPQQFGGCRLPTYSNEEVHWGKDLEDLLKWIKAGAKKTWNGR